MTYHILAKYCFDNTTYIIQNKTHCDKVSPLPKARKGETHLEKACEDGKSYRRHLYQRVRGITILSSQETPDGMMNS